MSDESATYLSYLLRLWREEQNGTHVWRASLESAQTRERSSFSQIEELLGFICERTGTLTTEECTKGGSVGKT